MTRLTETGSGYMKRHILYYPVVVAIMLLVGYSPAAEGG